VRTIFAILKNYPEGETAIDALYSRDFDLKEMNAILLKSTARNFMSVNQERIKIEKSSGPGREAVSRGLDRMLGGEQGVRVPDVGEVVAAGQLADILVRAAGMPPIGKGGLRAALVDFGVSNEAAQVYTDGVKAGGVLFMLRAPDERAPEAADTLRQVKAQRVSAYRG
jgi:hypothetical protein